ncbi:hypothetical protein RUND412_007960 [Rhizina undulata]
MQDLWDIDTRDLFEFTNGANPTHEQVAAWQRIQAQHVIGLQALREGWVGAKPFDKRPYIIDPEGLPGKVIVAVNKYPTKALDVGHNDNGEGSSCSSLSANSWYNGTGEVSFDEHLYGYLDSIDPFDVMDMPAIHHPFKMPNFKCKFQNYWPISYLSPQSLCKFCLFAEGTEQPNGCCPALAIEKLLIKIWGLAVNKIFPKIKKYTVVHDRIRVNLGLLREEMSCDLGTFDAKGLHTPAPDPKLDIAYKHLVAVLNKWDALCTFATGKRGEKYPMAIERVRSMLSSRSRYRKRGPAELKNEIWIYLNKEFDPVNLKRLYLGMPVKIDKGKGVMRELPAKVDKGKGVMRELPAKVDKGKGVMKY